MKGAGCRSLEAGGTSCDNTSRTVMSQSRQPGEEVEGVVSNRLVRLVGS